MHRAQLISPVTILILLQDTGTVLILLQDTGAVLILVKGEAGAFSVTPAALFQDGVVVKDGIFVIIIPAKAELVVQIDFARVPWLKIHGSI